MYRAAAGLAILAAACTNIDLQPGAAWQADLVPTTAAPVSGRVAVVTGQGQSSEAGIDLVGDPLTLYGWQVNQGTCAAPGALMGGRAAYADIETDSAGTGRIARTFVNVQFETRLRYHARIVDAEDRAIVLACGEMERFGSGF